VDSPETAVATLVGILASLAAIFRGVGAFFGWLTDRAQKRRMAAVPPTAGHVPGEPSDRGPSFETVLENHWRERCAKIEQELHEERVANEALRRQLRECDDTSASLASEATAKTYELERVKVREASLAAENDELRRAIDAGEHEDVPKKGSATRLRVIEVDARHSAETDPPPLVIDIHDIPTPKPGRIPVP
jgi:hypothetical protein